MMSDREQISRDQYRAIKRMSRMELSDYLVRVYQGAFKDALRTMAGEDGGGKDASPHCVKGADHDDR